MQRRSPPSGCPYAPGDQLPTEARLADRFGVNRHTVRRALGALSEAGLVHAQRGTREFVQHGPISYPIGRKVRFHQNLTAAGRIPAKGILLLDTRLPDDTEADALKLVTDAKVHVYEGVSLADSIVIAVFRSVFPFSRFPNMLHELSQTQCVTAAFKAHGLED